MAIPTRHSDRSRIIAGPRTFFVTSSIAEKRNLLQSERAADLFVKVLYDYREQRKFLLHEFVIMPDHFHLLLTVDSTLTIERAMQFIKGGFAFRAARELGFKVPVWQRGFSEIRVLDPEACRKMCEYIRKNPVVRHLAVEGEKFPYSSANQQFELDPIPLGLKPTERRAAFGMAKAMP
jgi:putative transposase